MLKNEEILKLAQEVIGARIVIIAMQALLEIQQAEFSKPNGIESDAFKIASKAITDLMSLGGTTKL